MMTKENAAPMANKGTCRAFSVVFNTREALAQIGIMIPNRGT
jgi:hypothetical protein